MRKITKLRDAFFISSLCSHILLSVLSASVVYSRAIAGTVLFFCVYLCLLLIFRFVFVIIFLFLIGKKMNIEKANSLVNSLKEKYENACIKKDLLAYIRHDFVSTLWNQEVVERDSLRGFVTHFFCSNKKFEKLQEKAIKVFAEAIQQITAQNESSDPFFHKLKAEFNQVYISKPTSNTPKSAFDNPVLLPIKAKTFRRLFNATVVSSNLTLRYFISFLDKHQNYVPSESTFSTRKASIKKEVGLPPVGESYLIHGHYGESVKTLKGFAGVFSKLPGGPLHLSNEVQDTINAPIPDPQKFIFHLLKRFTDKALKSLPGLEYAHSSAMLKILNILLTNHDNHVPEAIKKILPNCVINEVEAILQNGLIGNLVDFMNKGTLRSLLIWACLNGELMKSPAKRKELLEEFSKNKLDALENSIENPNEMLAKFIQNFTASFDTLFHDNIYSTLGVSDYLCGTYWLEIKSTEEGKYELLVYGLSKNTLIFKNLQQEQLSNAFLEGLQSSSNKTQLHEHLKKLPKPEEEPIQFDSIWLKDGVSSETIIFEMRFLALVGFCHPHFKNGKLQILNSLISDDISKALNTLKRDFKAQAESLEKEKRKEIESTFQLIEEGLFERTNPKFDIPPTIAQPILKASEEMGLTSTHLVSFKTKFSKLFGKEIEPLFDFLIHILNHSPEKVKGPKWSQKSLFIKITAFIWTLMDALIEGALLLMSLGQSGFTLFAAVTGVDWIARNLAPKAYKKEYKAILKNFWYIPAYFLFTSILRAVFKIGHLIFTPKVQPKDQNYWKIFLDNFERYGHFLNNKQKLSFQIKTRPKMYITHPLVLQGIPLDIKRINQITQREEAQSNPLSNSELLNDPRNSIFGIEQLLFACKATTEKFAKKAEEGILFIQEINTHTGLSELIQRLRKAVNNLNPGLLNFEDIEVNDANLTESIQLLNDSRVFQSADLTSRLQDSIIRQSIRLPNPLDTEPKQQQVRDPVSQLFEALKDKDCSKIECKGLFKQQILKLSSESQNNIKKWASDDGRYVVEQTAIGGDFESDLETLPTEVVIRQFREGVSYCYLPITHDFIQKANLYLPEIAEFCWVEENEAKDIRRLIICGAQSELLSVYLKKDPNNSNKYRINNYRIGQESRMPVDLKKDHHFLQALYRFCAPSKIRAWPSKKNRGVIDIIQLPYGLAFHVENVGEKRRANGQEKYEGYHIASNQTHDSLKGLASYLLLKSNTGKGYKILIPADQWLSSMAWKGLQHLGPLANFFIQHINDLNNKLVVSLQQMLGVSSNEHAYYELDIDESGRITGNDPTALAYLATLFILQNNLVEAYDLLVQLDRLLHPQAELPEGFNQMLAMIYLASFQSGEFQEIRMSLLSKLEKNDGYQKSLNKTKRTWQHKILSVLLAFKVLTDMEQSNRADPALLQMVLRNLKFLVKKDNVALEDILNPDLHKKLSNIEKATD